MAFAWCVRKSASKLASVCGRVRSISVVVNRPSIALKPSPLSPFVSRSFFYSMAVDQLSSEQTLLLAIDSELNSASQNDDLALGEEMTPESFFPFEIEDDPGDQNVTLRRDYNGEDIEVSAGMPYLDDDVIDAFGPSCPHDELWFTIIVTITKKSGLSLVFGCQVFADYMKIRSLTVNHPKDSMEYPKEIDWPPLKNLEDNLKKALQRYLTTRVEASTTKLLHKYMLSKAKREYLIWLKTVKKFVDG